MKNYNIVSLEPEKDADYDEELEKGSLELKLLSIEFSLEIDKLRDLKIKEEKAIKQKKVVEEAFQELERLKKYKKSSLSAKQIDRYPSNYFEKKPAMKKLPSTIISLNYNISNVDSKLSNSIRTTPLRQSNSCKIEEKKEFAQHNQQNDLENIKQQTKFPIIPTKSQQSFKDKPNEANKNQENCSENIPNQIDLMFSNLQMASGVKYSDNYGNVKISNENNIASPQIVNKNGMDYKPIRMSRTEYMNIVKNQGNFIRKKYIADEKPKPITHVAQPFSQNDQNNNKKFAVNQENTKKSGKNWKFDVIDEQNQILENDNNSNNNISHEENTTKEVIDRVGVKNYEHNRTSFENKKGSKKKNDNIIINNPIYLKELLLCD